MKLSREDVIRMAAEVASISETDLFGKANFVFSDNAVQRFAQLAYEAGAKAEREECAKLCDFLRYIHKEGFVRRLAENTDLADAIRSRGDK
jgi:hypothetical protein